MQSIASIQQTVPVIPGTGYTISWYERGRPAPPNAGWGPNNDLNVSVNGASVYNETNIADTGSWVAKSATWTAPAGITSAIVKFYSTNPLGGDHTVFIDNTSMVATTPAPSATTGTGTGTATTTPAPAAGTGITTGSGVATTPLSGPTPIASSLGAPLSTIPVSPNGVQPTPLSLAPGAYNAPNLYVLSYGYVPH